MQIKMGRYYINLLISMINISDLKYHIHLLTSMINISDPNVGLTVQIPYTNERYYIQFLISMINVVGLTVQIPYTYEKISYTFANINDKHQ